MAVMRAVENRFALARSGRNGLLTLSDNRGRIIAEATTVPGRFVSVTGKVNVACEQTLYAQSGDWFAWLCVATFVILIVSQLVTRLSTARKAHERVFSLQTTTPSRLPE
jgi:apolipoprotein N-acyltransferase